jgi:primosomal protein N' (replication factor Y) (superfamily II helicase)
MKTEKFSDISTSDKSPVYGTVALSLPFKFYSGGAEGLTYTLPEELRDRAKPGVRVLVPLGKREKTGVLVSVQSEATEKSIKTRSIIDVLDAEPVFDDDFLQWTKWIATYYLTSWGEILAAALPEGLKPETKSRVTLIGDLADRAIADLKSRAPRKAIILEAIAAHPSGVSIDRLAKEITSKSLYATLHALESEQYIKIERLLSRQASIKKETIVELASHFSIGSDALSDALTDLEKHAPRQANILLAIVQQMHIAPDEPLTLPLLLKKAGATRSTFQSLIEKEYIAVAYREKKSRVSSLAILPEASSEEDITKITLTDEQGVAVETIAKALQQKEPRTFLLHGVTGSGKTEVYISLARQVLEHQGGVLILVPEIALTPQLIERFKRRLSMESDDSIAVLHSRMSMNERYAAWHALANGRIRIAIGARSAVFAPIRDLQLIIIDEEHEATYKQYDKTPRYNARDMAIVRASMLGVVCVLGSATPSVESYFNAREGKYTLIELTQRAKRAQLPSVKIVDLRTAENRRDFAKAKTALTPSLRAAMEKRMERQEGIVLFQNRRGFSTYLECIACGTPEMCPNCSVTLTYHRAKNQMRCHYCGFIAQKRTTCSTCGSDALRLGGMGTQRVEDDILKAFPNARILRMDLDTTSKKGAYHKILSTFAAGEADILLGTQMVAKGLDFPRVTLVGVISADTSLCLPDFRASERTFQLLTQVSGRAGRSLEPGEVLVQTLQPAHPAIELAVAHDYKNFFQQELADRARLTYPPYSRLILIEFRGLHERAVEERAHAFATLFPERSSFYERIGPSPPAIAKLRNEFRWHLLMKDFKKHDPNGDKIRRLIMGALEQYQKRFASPAVKIIVDVDVQGVT